MKKVKLFILIVLSILLVWIVFWAWQTWSDTWWMWEWLQLMQKILDFLYLVIRPFLYLWWKFLSNEFVYGWAFHIDVVLWKIWQMVRIFMNYFLGFVLIVSIWVYLLKSDSKLAFKNILPKVVVASVVINASWFIMAVLIDLSTILTVAAWWMWYQFTSLIKKWANVDLSKETAILPITLDVDSWKTNIKPEKINGKEYTFCITDKDGKYLNVDKKPCLDMMWWTFKFVVSKDGKTEPIKWWITWGDLNGSSVWMLFSLFRYMNFAFVEDNTNTQNATFWLMVVKTVLMIILIIPFIVLSIILIIRIMVLWVWIPLSPILLGLPILWVFDSKVKKHLTDIISIIFQPAYVVFMLSLWFIVIQSLYVMMPDRWDKQQSENILKKMKIKQIDKNTLEIWGIAEISQSSDSKNGKNKNMSDYKNILSYISWIIVNLMAAMLMWVLVFTALKSNKFTEKIAGGVDTFGRQWAKSIPFLPWGQSISSLKQVWWFIQQLPQQKASTQSSKLKTLFKNNEDTDNNDT